MNYTGKNPKKLFLCLLFVLLVRPCFSVQKTDSVITKRTYKTSFSKVEPLIDGNVNEECWNLVEWTSDFIQSQPVENKPPSQQTAFKILYDNDNIYMFIHCFDNEPGKISKIMSRRDNFSGDIVFVEFDSHYDKRTAYLFSASASGAKSDAAMSEDGQNEDDSWNPIWYMKTSADKDGWNAEMKIPLSQLRFDKNNSQTWGLQVTRKIFRLQERSQWQFVPKGSPGVIHLFGELYGIDNIKPKRQIELMPYTVARTERFQKTEGDPFNTGKLSKISAGLDGKIGLSNNFTLDFTINPDFGQVEADPSEVNLTAFESYFSEKRSFFIEGRNIYQFAPDQTIVIHNMSSDNLFYSRRIGKYPQYYPSVGSGAFIRMPESTTILGAVKISGKTKKGLSVGIMESLTSREDALIDSAGFRSKETVEPLTNYFTGRIQQDLNKGQTILGAIITSVNRDIKSTNLDFLHSAAYTAGLDFQHNWNDRTWYIAGNAEYSNVRGSTRSITETQLSSARYYQRPDAGYLSVDSSLTSLPGYGGTLKFGKSSKKRFQFETCIIVRSPGLEFNDIGYMRYSDVIYQGNWMGYYLRNPFWIFNNFYLNTNLWEYFNFDGQLLSINHNTNFNAQFKNKWQLNGQFNRQGQNISTTLLRGGPSFTLPGNQSFNMNISSDRSKKLSFSIGNYHGSGDAKSSSRHNYYGDINYRPTNSIAISVDPEYGIQDSEMQYVKTVTGAGEPVYLFGKLNQKTSSLTFRINYTINPELSIEYYGQPFISAGKYSAFKRVTNPDAERFRERFAEFTPAGLTYSNGMYKVNDGEGYSFENPDFNFRQFRSNLVVRWEYLPGSTIYLVWSQGRTSNDKNGMFSYGNDVKELFSTMGHNTFLVKVSYWFNL
ncbi:MAG TPA: DUF5916 domain-containing protein [Bacteroidales bacterium]|nr:DUF5916 domain-containing protein [Bacteroidales bacterium]